jgi:hypothetical protein
MACAKLLFRSCFSVKSTVESVLATFLAKSITCSNALDFPIILSKEYLSEIAFLIVGLSVELFPKLCKSAE